MNPTVQGLLRVAMTTKPFRRLWAPLMRGRATIFMLHRFADPELGVDGHDPSFLRAALAYLRRERYELIDLVELFRRLRESTPNLDRAVAFTMDDGYHDQGAVGCEIFASFDCPVTTFVTTGFLDGALWLWWDRIEYVFNHTPCASLEVELGSAPVRYTFAPATKYRHAQADFIARCTKLAEPEKLAAIECLAAAAHVELPERPPRQYAPMGWDQVRDLERRGMRFGPHTVHHPILSRTSADESRREIADSWRRLREQAQQPVAVFCYPNGQAGDYGDREIGVLTSLGFTGAVVGTIGYADAAAFHAGPEGPFRVRRFGYPHELSLLAQSTSGFERVSQLIRGLA